MDFGTRSVGFWNVKAVIVFGLLICIYLCSSVAELPAQGLPIAKPEAVGMNSAKLAQIEQIVNADIADKKLPGAVVVVGHKGKIVYRKAFGNRSLVPKVEKMTVDTIFDVASLTKVVATTTSIMILVEQGKVRLNDTIGKFIPDIDDPEAKKVTIQQLLTHTSGYRPDFDLGEKWTGREGMLAALKKEKLRNPPGTRFVYSDINFEVLGEIVAEISDEVSLKYFAKEYLFEPVGMRDSNFIEHISAQNVTINSSTGAGTLNPYLQGSRTNRVAPTENVQGQQSYLGSSFQGPNGDRVLRGEVHDPTANRMDGVAGHAGLFSTADDLARFCQMLLNGGVVPVRTGSGSDRISAGPKTKNPVATAPGSDRILSAQTIARMTQPYVVSEDGATRGLGWDMNTSFSSNRGELFPLGSFGHTGFTGTSIWIDPTSQTFVVFLSNRVHPDGKGDVTPLRARVSTIVASAIEDTPIEKWKEAEARYFAAVAAQIPKFKATVEAANRSTGVATVPVAGGAGRSPLQSVANGIDVLERTNFKDLDGKRIGLVTNHTGINLAGKSTIDVLFEAKNVKLVSLFAPEHGIRGELDTEKIDDTKDAKTGLHVYSMYKEGLRRPKPEHLRDLDAIVYDIQDVGTRFYTYTATLKNVMEEAAKAKISVYVLDRPNPINGIDIEGALADEDKLAFIAAHTVPVRYGMTIGELGMLMNAERKIGADLRVIKMENWSRAMWFDETGQTWINPSPNMRSLNEATLYPGIGLLEYTNVSVGRGTDTPFEIIGAPWMDGQKLAKYLNDRALPGIRFVPIRFKPNASVFKDENLGGVNFVVTDRKAFRSVRTGIEIAVALRKLFPNDWKIERFAGLLLNQDIFDRVKRGETPEQIDAVVRPIVTEFERRRAPYLLYK